MREQKKIPCVVFYTSISRLFRATLIGHLYEIAQVYPVVLLSEKLDSETETALNNKELFPRLQAVIPVLQYTRWHTNFFTKNRHFWLLAKNVIAKYQPDIVITGNDIYPFEMYLMRYAKRIGAQTICIQGGFKTAEKEQDRMWPRLLNAQSKAPSFLPLWCKLLLGNIKKYAGHFLYYWIAPLLVGELPFRGNSSFVLWNPAPGFRDADYVTVFSERDYDLYLKDDIPKKKLCILSHPLEGKTRNMFEKIYFLSSQKEKNKTSTLTLLLPAEEIGFRKADLSLIPKEEMQKMRKEIVKLLNYILNGWKIIIKPHPDTQNIHESRRIFEAISDQITVVDPSEPVDTYITAADVIVGIPPASTALFTASLQCPAKPILSLDFHRELMGDDFQDFEGIEYIASEEHLVRVLQSVKNNSYQRKQKKKLERKGFASAVELIEHLGYEKEK